MNLIHGADFPVRIDLLASQGYTVMISDYVRFFRLRAYLRRGRGEWEQAVPESVAQRIIAGRLLGYDT